MTKHFDMGSLIVIVVTFVLFVAALFVKGLSKDILLEAGVFLVSVKLIMMAYQNSSFIEGIESELKDIKGLLKDEMAKR